MKPVNAVSRLARSVRESDGRRHLSTGVVFAGTLLGLLDTTVVNVALPSIASDLGADKGIEWVVTGHLLALGVTQAPTGWLSDRLGLRPVFLGSLGVFAVFAALASAAPNLAVLVAARVGQGLCSGAALAVGILLLFEMTPRETRGRVIGYGAGLSMIAPAFGPLVSGWIVTSLSWRWLFLAFVPFCALVLAAAVRLVPQYRPGENRPMDAIGTLLLTVSLVGFLTACSRAADWGLSSSTFLATIAVSLVVAVIFWVRASRSPHPLIEPKLYRSKDFSICMAVLATLMMAHFARQVFVPLEIQVVHGLSPVSAGAVLTPAALLTAATLPLAGRAVDRYGAKAPIVAGLVLAALFTGLLATTNESTPMSIIAAIVAGASVGTAMVAMPIALLSLSSVARRLRTQASAVRNLTRWVASALGTAVLATVIVSDVGSLTGIGDLPEMRSRAQSAYNQGFMVAAVILVAGLALSLLLTNRRTPSGSDST